MNGLINPIKQLFRKKVEPPVPTPIEKEFNEPLTIPSEHSNHMRSPFYQDENDDDYFVYKLEPEGNKWGDWDEPGKRSPYSPGFLGAQVSDTIRNSNIHVFPDRQDLVNPTMGRGLKYGNHGLQNNYYGRDLYKNDQVNNGYQQTNVMNAPSEDEKDPNMLKILPSYLLEDSQPNIDQNNQVDNSKANNNNKHPRHSSDFQAYCNVIPQPLDISNIEAKKSIDDYSAIVPSKKIRSSLDDSEDMNFAQVISTLEKNIAKAKAYRHGGPKQPVSRQGLKIKLNPSRKQDDTLSLDQSSGAGTNTYLGESQDLRAKFLKRDDSNRTVFYSFASTDKHISGIAEYAHPNYPNGNTNEKQNGFYYARNNFIQNLPALTRIEEETISGKTYGRNELSPSATEFMLSTNKNTHEPNPLARNRFTEPTIQGMDFKTVRPRNAHTQFTTNTPPQKGHTRAQSHGMAINFNTTKPIPKNQPSENYVLCINCNDLLPFYIVDKHSIYCNETMMATEELTSEIMLEAKNPQVTLERCNIRLKKLKILLEKNLRNLKGQVQLGIVILEDCESVLSVIELITRIAEEIIRNDKIASKLKRDTMSMVNFKEDLSPFIDIVLAGIIINNVDIFIQTSKLKEKALELVLKKAKEHMQYPSYEDSKGSLTSKLDFEKLRLSSAATPNKTNNKPSSMSYRPGTIENYGQSTAGGSSLASQRMPHENRVPLSGDWMDAVMRSSKKKDYY